jgi:sugar lactone lactonase YvrE
MAGAMIGQPRVVVDGLTFPEGPRWFGDRLWFVDMHSHTVRAVDPKGNPEVIAEFPDKPSGMGLMPDGSVICVSVRRRLVERIGLGGERTPHADLNDLPGESLNDMVVDAHGRAYVGNRFPRPSLEVKDPVSPENVVLVEPDGTHRVVAENLVAPNGSVIAPDGRVLIVAEALGHRLMAFDIETDGSLSNRRIYAETGEYYPDGICLDAEGAIWFGSPITGAFVRILEGGRVTEVITMPEGKWAIACMLGGPDRRTLYMATSRITLADLVACKDYESDLRSTGVGWIEAVEVEVPGAGLP